MYVHVRWFVHYGFSSHLITKQLLQQDIVVNFEDVLREIFLIKEGEGVQVNGPLA